MWNSNFEFYYIVIEFKIAFRLQSDGLTSRQLSLGLPPGAFFIIGHNLYTNRNIYVFINEENFQLLWFVLYILCFKLVNNIILKAKKDYHGMDFVGNSKIYTNAMHTLTHGWLYEISFSDMSFDAFNFKSFTLQYFHVYNEKINT